MSPDTTLTLGATTPRPLTLRSAVMAASGTVGYGVDYERLTGLSRIGAIVTPSLTLRPRPNRAGPRWIETASGVVRDTLHPNRGVRAVLRKYERHWAGLDVPVIASVVGDSLEEYVTVARELEERELVAGLEVNALEVEPDAVPELVEAVRAVCTLPLIVKLSPAGAALVSRLERAGADAVTLSGGFPALAIDTGARKPVLDTADGWLCGPAIRPLVLRLVWEVAQVAQLPVIGCGGIASADDALQLIMAGASAVQVGSATFRRPSTLGEVAEGLQVWMEQSGLSSLEKTRGCALPSGAESA
ncbi:MAG: dihydroorotate dehydrogenase [Chloroflexota bacterium]|nr:dihydroorotate dehydrogenase [Chloroflexota bacterium]